VYYKIMHVTIIIYKKFNVKVGLNTKLTQLAQRQNVAFITTKIQSYVPSMTKDDYMTTSP
jgi:hypothetical protein